MEGKGMMKNKIKAVAAVVLAAGMIASSMTVFAFTDVNKGNWAEAPITALSNAGYVNGYTDGSFRPDDCITRAEFVTIINNIKGNTAVSEKAFSDLANSAWYYDSIGKAVAAGYIAGYDDNTVRPDDYITREEACVIAYRAWNLTPSGKVNFVDSNEIGAWSKAQVATLVNKKIINGYEDGSFRPAGYMSRAEVAKMLYCLISMDNNIAKTTSTDKKGVIGGTLIVH